MRLTIIFLLISYCAFGQAPTITSSNDNIVPGYNASLTSSASTAYTISTTKWTKFSVPGMAQKKIVFIGSSTTAGFGTTGYVAGSTNDSSYVGRTLNYYYGLGLLSTKTGCNLGQSSTDIFDGQPSWYVPTGSQHAPLTGKNITAALALNPDMVIVSYPSNSYDFLSITEVMQGFRRIKATTDSAGKICVFSTTLPRAGFSPSEKLKLIEISDSIKLQFPNNYIDFYAAMAQPAAPTVAKTAYAYGDGVHFNDAGHEQFLNRIVEYNPFRYWAIGPAVISTPTTANTTIVGADLGVHKYLVSVVDNQGLAKSSISTVTVACNANTPVKYTQAATGPGEIYITNAKDNKPWRGGDTLTIDAGTYSVLHIDSLRGDPCNKLHIRFSPGVIVTGAIRFNYAYDVDITGYDATRSAQKYCGPKAKEVSLVRVRDINFDYIEVGPNPDGVGVYCKQDVDTSLPSTWRSSGFVMKNIKLRNLWVHDIEGEGFYFGHTSYDGDDYHVPASGIKIPAILLDSCEVSYCWVENTGWDGIQLSGAQNGNLIHHNTVINFGTLDAPGQKAGILSGGGTNSKIYNNTIRRGKGNGLQVFGYGLIEVYNNTIDSSGQTMGDYDAAHSIYKGEQSVYMDDRPSTTLGTLPALQIYFHDNSIIHSSIYATGTPYASGALSIPNGNGTMGNSTIINNTFCIAGADASWQSKYLKIQPVGSTNTGNILLCPGAIIRTYFKGKNKFRN